MFFEQFEGITEGILTRFTRPAQNIFLDFDYRWFVGYLFLATLTAFLIIFFRNIDPRQNWSENLKNASSRLFARHIFLHESARLDYRYAIVNHLTTSAILVYLIVAINVMSGAFYGLFNGLALFDGLNVTVGWVGAVLIVLLYAFAYDTTNFFQHILQHKVPILWEFHKVHHSAEVLTPVTAVRLHPVAQLVAATVGAMVYGSLNGLMYNIFAGETAQYSLFGANLFALLFYTVGLYHLKHSHVWFTYPRFIKDVFASPSLHLIHHSNDPRHYDKNLGFVFTFWDRVFGTYYDPKPEDREGLVLGISESEGRDEYCTVKQLYLTPFKRAWKYHLKPALQTLRARTAQARKQASAP